MQSLAERLQGFAAALLDPHPPAPAGLLGPDGEPSPRRFSVYRNNVVVGLTGALKANYPAVCRIAGEEFFEAMARIYVVCEPPASPVLLDYGAGFPDFIAGFPPAQELTYLPDVARIERAWLEAYHAAEAAPLAAEALADIPPERVPKLRLSVHPSLRTVRSHYPALTIWRMNLGGEEPEPVDLTAGGEDVLVARPEAEVEVHAMPPGGYEFVKALELGAPLLEAMGAGLLASPVFDLQDNISGLVAAGIFTGFHFDSLSTS